MVRFSTAADRPAPAAARGPGPPPRSPSPASPPIHAYAAESAGGRLKPFEYDPGPLGAEEVEIAVEHCGICHSDLSMLDNDWGRSRYPLVPGHEIVGTVAALGAQAKGLALGQRVGLGWIAGSCTHCHNCLSGDHNFCVTAQPMIVGHHGGFADRVRAHWLWTVPLPEGIDAATAGPLFCGGITVFNPILQFGVQPTDRVGVIGIGGLGHLAIKFLRAWGCEVTAFTSSESKREEALRLGAHQVVATGDAKALARLAGRFQFLLVTINAAQDWGAYLATLAPRGRLHFVGAVLDPLAVRPQLLFGNQKSISGSPLGSPAMTATMLEFAARHGIAPQAELFPMAQVNDAIEHLRAGKARYRVILTR
ncbi:MAG: NAD(P)-dependent alcohol dehydrogenase [Nevskia sp.]